jgi:two-component system sensor histidine kinase YesM
MEISELAAGQRVPKLILQPIVENAIVHGIEPMVEPGRIDIFADVQGEDLVIRVTDNGVGIPAEKLSLIFEQQEMTGPDAHTNIGVRNVHRRIKLYYGDQYGVVIESREGVGTQVTLRMPATIIEPA